MTINFVLSYRNFWEGNGVVKISTIYSWDFVYATFSSPFETFYLIKLKSITSCIIFEWKIGLWPKWSTLILPQYKIGTCYNMYLT